MPTTFGTRVLAPQQADSMRQTSTTACSWSARRPSRPRLSEVRAEEAAAIFQWTMDMWWFWLSSPDTRERARERERERKQERESKRERERDRKKERKKERKTAGSNMSPSAKPLTG